ncbi:MAG: hypothetical protein ACKVQB_10775 [Bacteroidia bacterium]
MKNLSFILLFISWHSFANKSLQSFEPTNVTINLNKLLQPDSIGYNIPAELPRLIYSKIIDGSLILWDSPLKEIKISPDALKGIEQSSQTSFSNLENMFIHEIWELSKRYLDTKTIGFTFINKNEKGPVSYGYIDYKDIVVILDKNTIPCNANGFVNTTFREAIQGKQFSFSIVQFGLDDFKTNPKKAFEIQNQLFNNPKVKLYNSPKNTNQFKTITYEIYREGNENNEAVFSALSNYFKDNLEQFLNLGGDQTIPFFKKDPEINFTKIKVTELYKLEKGNITSEIATIQLFINGKYLPTSDIETMRQIGITVKFKPLETFINEKGYVFNIVSINSEEIKGLDSIEIIKKLNEGHWNRLVEH